MSHIGKESRMVELIQARTKMSKEDIYAVLWHLPEVFAEMIMEKSPDENCDIHLGVLNAHWQKTAAYRPEIVFSPTERFKKRFTELKVEGKTALARKLFENLPKNLKNKALKRNQRSDNASLIPFK